MPNVRRLFNRILNYLRPRPRLVPLTVGEILADNAGLDVVSSFIDLYYRSGAAGNLRWRGTDILKTPTDLWTSVELLQRLMPRVIVETGTHEGGSALFYSDIAKTLGFSCTVVTIDPNPKWSVDPEKEGIVSIRGYSTEQKVVNKVKQVIGQYVSHGQHVLVFLDSDHSADNVRAELEIYSSFVTVGSYIVVEDSIINGHPTFRDHGPGPWEAIQTFLGSQQSFAPDLSCERFLLTFNPRGWLNRLS